MYDLHSYELYLRPSGCLQLLEISWNLIGPPGNFCIRCRRSTALVSSHKNMDKYSSQKYEIYRHQMCSFKFQMHQNPFSAGALPRTQSPGPLWGSLWRSPDSHKSETVSQKWDCRRKRRNSATVALSWDSLTFLRQYGQAITVNAPLVRASLVRTTRTGSNTLTGVNMNAA